MDSPWSRKESDTTERLSLRRGETYMGQWDPSKSTRGLPFSSLQVPKPWASARVTYVFSSVESDQNAPPTPASPSEASRRVHVPPGGESLWKESLCTGQLWRGWPRCTLPVTLINTKFSQAHSIHTICQLTNHESDPQRTAKKELYWSSDLCHVSQSGECLQFGEPEVICFYPQFFLFLYKLLSHTLNHLMLTSFQE